MVVAVGGVQGEPLWQGGMARTADLWTGSCAFGYLVFFSLRVETAFFQLSSLAQAILLPVAAKPCDFLGAITWIPSPSTQPPATF